MNRNDLEHALIEADIPVLLMVLVHLTGDRKWIEAPFQPERNGRLFGEESGGLPADVQAEVRAAALTEIGRSTQGVEIADDTLQAMMTTCVGEPVGPEYVGLLKEEMGFSTRVTPPLPHRARAERSAVIIGAGVSGLCAAIRFEAMGLPYVILEKNPSIGGTWFENVYPEAGVDTPNHFYSYSFERDHEWTHYFSKQQEILDYLRSRAEKYDVTRHVVFEATAREARWDEVSQQWTTTVDHADGTSQTFDSTYLITAVGQLNQPKIPPIEGLDSFRGELFHTARWPTDLDLTGKRVALVGTGASAVQAARSIAAVAEHLTVYQRSAQWLMPNPDYHRTVSPSKQWLLTHVPFYAAWYRFTLFWRYSDGVHRSLGIDPNWPHPERSINSTNEAHRGYLLRHLQRELEGRPDLLAKATPSYPPYAKRMVVDNDWFATLRRDNVSLETDGVEHLDGSGVVAADGTHAAFDVIALATGFHATRLLWPLQVVGRDGLTIHDYWNIDDARAYLGITVPHFPNLFMLLGPNTSLAHGGSVVFHVECQVNYISHAIAKMVEQDVAVIECTEKASDDYTAQVSRAHERLVFSHPGTTNWYKNRAGRVVTVSPWTLAEYWRLTRRVDFADFIVTGGVPAGPSRTAPAPELRSA